MFTGGGVGGPPEEFFSPIPLPKTESLLSEIGLIPLLKAQSLEFTPSPKVNPVHIYG